MNLTKEQIIELKKCYESPYYFINNYVWIYDSVEGGWIPFKLWKAQIEALDTIHKNKYTIILKARQLGLTWLALAYILWHVLFRPIGKVLIFSRTLDEATELLDERLKKMYSRLPDWMRESYLIESDNKREFKLSNESKIKAVAKADSYTNTLVLLDEADIMEQDYGELFKSIQPTIDAAGKLIVLSIADKKKPDSAFKIHFKNAQKGLNQFEPVFIPWFAHPNRNETWYQKVKSNFIGDEDALYGQYPATPEEALQLGYAGRVFPNFDEKEQVRDDIPIDSGTDIIWSADYGFSNPSCVLFLQIHKRFDIINRIPSNKDYIYYFDEFYESGLSEREVLHKCFLHNHKMGYPLPTRFIFDSAQPAFYKEMAYFRDNGVRLDMDDKHSQLIYHPFSIRIQNADKRPNSIIESISIMRRFIGTSGNRRMFMASKCKNLIAELPAFIFSDNKSTMGGDPRIALGQKDHAVDAARYDKIDYMFNTRDME